MELSFQKLNIRDNSLQIYVIINKKSIMNKVKKINKLNNNKK